MSRSTRNVLAGLFGLASNTESSLARFTAAGHATDWTRIQEALHAFGVKFPGNVLRVELARQNLANFTFHGLPVPISEVAALANGFVAFKEAQTSGFYITGSLPAVESELSALLTALRANKAIQVTTIIGKVAGVSPQLVWVNFEAVGDGVAIATSLDTALQTIHSPQLHVRVALDASLARDAADQLPPEFIRLFKQGTLVQVNDTLVFCLPRPDEKHIQLRGGVPAAIGFGLGQSIYIQMPSWSGSRHTTLNAHFVLRRGEVQPVQDVLRAGGFNIASQVNVCLDARTHLVHLHASAFGNGVFLGNTILSAIEVIKLEASSRDPKADD